MLSRQKSSKLSKVISAHVQFLIRTGQVTEEVVTSRNTAGSVPSHYGSYGSYGPITTNTTRGWRRS